MNLEREVGPLVKSWTRVEREHDGRRFVFFENPQTVLVCGGLGPVAARRATEAAIALYQPVGLISAGFAGSLEAGTRVGQSVAPRTIVDTRDGSRTDTGIGSGMLVTFNAVAGAPQKAKLAQAYSAQAVDMEAAGVAQGAAAHGLSCVAFKVISDEMDFPMPPMERFVDGAGKFRTGRFVFYTILRPWTWFSVWKLARNSALASRNLCRWLEQFNYAEEGTLEPGLHPARRVRL